MNIDERIEALTPSVEFLASLHGDLEQQTATHLGRMADAITELRVAVEQDAANIRSLARIAGFTSDV